MEVIMTEKNRQINPYPLGAHPQEGGIRFSFISKKENCGVILYRREDGKRLQKIAFEEGERIGNVRYKWIPDVDADSVTYHFYEDDRLIADERARLFVCQSKYGRRRKEKELKAGFVSSDFDWAGDVRPRIPYEDCICYLLHVRGFTKHPSSKAEHKGTFLGVAEKLPYLKELGITTVELQPAYEFQEITLIKERSYGYLPAQEEPAGTEKLNYWGYKKGYYYAPKASYAAGEEASAEFKEMVRVFHKNRMEVVMQFYFPREFPRQEIVDILHFWVLEYHVDGFHLMGEQLPADLIASDQGLSDTKLWFDGIDADNIYGQESPSYRNLAVYRDDYMYVMRRFLKGDNDMLGSVLYHMRSNPEKLGRINYLTNYYGFTMMDLVSYNDKHNEDNGEDNHDGNNYNHSWNCGIEGPSRKKQIAALRTKQYKNAMSMLFLSQATPLIFMGDEFGNSQRGNNNPYCQDNEITWLNWRDLDKNKELYEFTAKLIRLRGQHPILHKEKELRIMDYLSYGYPDLSYHGAAAWRPSMESNDRQIGIMYCGKYARVDRLREDDFLYVALNMHWEARDFAMPRLPKGMKWELLYLTEDHTEEAMREPAALSAGKAVKDVRKTADAQEEEQGRANLALGNPAEEKWMIRRVPPRTTAVYISREKVSNE